MWLRAEQTAVIRSESSLQTVCLPSGQGASEGFWKLTFCHCLFHAHDETAPCLVQSLSHLTLIRNPFDMRNREGRVGGVLLHRGSQGQWCLKMTTTMCMWPRQLIEWLGPLSLLSAEAMMLCKALVASSTPFPWPRMSSSYHSAFYLPSVTWLPHRVKTSGLDSSGYKKPPTDGLVVKCDS